MALTSSTANAQTDFPNRRIHVVVPYPAGGIVDIATRIVTDKLSEIWRQPIVVEAKPGGNGNVAWDQVARAEPDGYTWVFIGPAVMANPHMYANLRWNEKSFVPSGGTVWAPSVFVVHPSLPVSTVSEFIDYARKRPGVLNWSSPGVGTSQHLNTAIFLECDQARHAVGPLRGTAAGDPRPDVKSRAIQRCVDRIGCRTHQPRVAEPLAVLGTARSPLLPNVPTITEAGYPEINVVPWYGYGVPRGTPPAIVDKILAGFVETMKSRACASCSRSRRSSRWRR